MRTITTSEHSPNVRHMFTPGEVWALRGAVWPDVEHPEDRTPENARHRLEVWVVVGCEWPPKYQRMVVRFTNGHGGEVCLTRHELALNGINGELQ